MDDLPKRPDPNDPTEPLRQLSPPAPAPLTVPVERVRPYRTLAERVT